MDMISTVVESLSSCKVHPDMNETVVFNIFGYQSELYLISKTVFNKFAKENAIKLIGV